MNCIYKCSEHVSVALLKSPPMLDSDKDKPTTTTATNTLLEVNYTNTNLMPIQDHRQLKIFPKDKDLENKKEPNTLKLFEQKVLSISTKRDTIAAKLVIGGDCRQEELRSPGSSGIKQSLGSGGLMSNHKRQIRICSSIGDNDKDGQDPSTSASSSDRASSDYKITSNDLIKAIGGCNMQIDSLTIILESPSTLIRKEAEQQGKIVIPQAYINRYGLSVASLDDLGSSHHLGHGGGLVVYGVASVDAYNHVLKQIRFTYGIGALNKENGNLERTFKVIFILFLFRNLFLAK